MAKFNFYTYLQFKAIFLILVDHFFPKTTTNDHQKSLQHTNQVKVLFLTAFDIPLFGLPDLGLGAGLKGKLARITMSRQKTTTNVRLNGKCNAAAWCSNQHYLWATMWPINATLFLSSTVFRQSDVISPMPSPQSKPPGVVLCLANLAWLDPYGTRAPAKVPLGNTQTSRNHLHSKVMKPRWCQILGISKKKSANAKLAGFFGTWFFPDWTRILFSNLLNIMCRGQVGCNIAK